MRFLIPSTTSAATIVCTVTALGTGIWVGKNWNCLAKKVSEFFGKSEQEEKAVNLVFGYLIRFAQICDKITQSEDSSSPLECALTNQIIESHIKHFIRSVIRKHHSYCARKKIRLDTMTYFYEIITAMALVLLSDFVARRRARSGSDLSNNITPTREDDDPLTDLSFEHLQTPTTGTVVDVAVADPESNGSSSAGTAVSADGAIDPPTVNETGGNSSVFPPFESTTLL